MKEDSSNFHKRTKNFSPKSENTKTSLPINVHFFFISELELNQQNIKIKTFES